MVFPMLVCVCTFCFFVCSCLVLCVCLCVFLKVFNTSVLGFENPRPANPRIASLDQAQGRKPAYQTLRNLITMGDKIAPDELFLVIPCVLCVRKRTSRGTKTELLDNNNLT